MAVALKGGIDGAFAGFETLRAIVSDFAEEVEKIATKLDDAKFLCSAAWDASKNTWAEYGIATYRCGRYGENENGFADWHERSLYFQKEVTLASDCVQEYRWQVNQITVELVEAMGQWYDALVARSGQRCRAWVSEYAQFGKLHKKFVRRFWEYGKLLGKEVPVIE